MQAGPKGADQPLGEQPRVLVVDDEPVIREVLAEFLSMEGFWVRTADHGGSALTELSRHAFDIVLSDLKMPTMGGIELLAAIRTHTPSVVTVLMTGFGTVETAIEAMKQGAYDYILKPFKMEEVVHTLRRALEKRQLEADNLRMKEALSLYKVSEAIAASLSLDEVLKTVVDAAVHEVGADHVSVVLSDGAGSFYERVSISNPRFHPLAPLPKLQIDELRAYFEDDKPLRLAGAACGEFAQVGEDLMRPHALMSVPLRVRKKAVGFLSVLSYTLGRSFDEGQRKLLQLIASRAAAALENAKLYEDLKATFEQTIRGLASAIDKMDRYTAGHSERVAGYAQLLAIKLGLSPEEVELARQAALMHDIGKIGCVLNLNKPGKLSHDEYDVFKKHPEYGRDILEPITFLHPLIPGVLLHHERWDGGGYPLGLKAGEIPLIARIISVADTYDAMTSDRAYRKALPHEVALNEIDRCANHQFDPECSGTFKTAVELHREQLIASGESIPE